MEIKCNSSEKYFIQNAIRAEIRNHGCPFDRDYCDDESSYCEKCINKRITWIDEKLCNGLKIESSNTI